MVPELRFYHLDSVTLQVNPRYVKYLKDAQSKERMSQLLKPMTALHYRFSVCGNH